MELAVLVGAQGVQSGPQTANAVHAVSGLLQYILTLVFKMALWDILATKSMVWSPISLMARAPNLEWTSLVRIKD